MERERHYLLCVVYLLLCTRTHLHLPLFYYGGKHLNYFDEQGHYRDKVSVRSYGKLELEACGTGTLVLTAGNTLRQVLCLHTDRRFTDRVESLTAQDFYLIKKKSFFSWK